MAQGNTSLPNFLAGNNGLKMLISLARAIYETAGIRLQEVCQFDKPNDEPRFAILTHPGEPHQLRFEDLVLQEIFDHKLKDIRPVATFESTNYPWLTGSKLSFAQSLIDSGFQFYGIVTAKDGPTWEQLVFCCPESKRMVRLSQFVNGANS